MCSGKVLVVRVVQLVFLTLCYCCDYPAPRRSGYHILETSILAYHHHSRKVSKNKIRPIDVTMWVRLKQEANCPRLSGPFDLRNVVFASHQGSRQEHKKRAQPPSRVSKRRLAVRQVVWRATHGNHDALVLLRRAVTQDMNAAGQNTKRQYSNARVRI